MTTADAVYTSHVECWKGSRKSRQIGVRGQHLGHPEGAREGVDGAREVLPAHRAVGEILQLDLWILDLSPFARVPKLPGADLAIGPLLALSAIAAALGAAGLAGVRRRDIG